MEKMNAKANATVYYAPGAATRMKKWSSQASFSFFSLF